MGKGKFFRYAPTVLLFGIICVSCSGLNTPTPTATVPPTRTPTPGPPTPTPTLDPRPSETSVPDVEGTVRVWLDWSLEEIQALEPHLTDFQELFPLVQIEISYFPPEEILERFREAVVDGIGPSILIGNSQWASKLNAEGLVREISDRVSSDIEDIISSVAWESVREGRSFFGLPFSMDGIVLYRNSNLIDAPVDTIELMREMLDELEPENKVGAFVDIGFLYTGAHFSTCEGQFVNLAGELELTHKSLECWLRLLKTFSNSSRAVQNSDLDFNSFISGGSAWLVDGSGRADEIITGIGVDGIAIDRWPQYAAVGNALNGYIWTRNIYFSNTINEAEFDAAWLIARYLLTEDVQGSIAHASLGRQYPVLTDLEYQTDWLQQMMSSLHRGIPLPPDPVLSFFSEELEPAAFDVVRRRYDPYWITQWAMSNITTTLSFRGGRIE